MSYLLINNLCELLIVSIKSPSENIVHGCLFLNNLKLWNGDKIDGNEMTGVLLMEKHADRLKSIFGFCCSSVRISGDDVHCG